MAAASDVPSPAMTPALSSPSAGSSRIAKYKGFLDAIASGPVNLARTGSLTKPQGKWSISVAEITPAQRDAERAATSALPPSPLPETPEEEELYTLYVQNPTHNLTLTRSAAALATLDAALRKRRLSVPPLPPSTGGTHARTSSIATYLTALAASPAVVQTEAWKHFVRVEADDLQSVRVERRVRKMRSDLAQHVLSSVAPRNINITDPDEAAFNSSFAASTASEDESDEARPRPVSKIFEEPASERLEPEDAEMAEVEDVERGTRAMSLDVEPADTSQRRTDKVTVNDFEVVRVLGKGCAGKVLLVRHKGTKGLYAMKSIHKRHVLAHQELSHTITEQAVLKRMASEQTDPFVVKLWWSFHDAASLYLVMDFQAGGDLATQLTRWGRLGRDRARFYAAEIAEGVEGLHRIGVIYRDLKPENVLINANGHVVLSDFGLSKGFWLTPGEKEEPEITGTLRANPPHWLLAGEEIPGLAGRKNGRPGLRDPRHTTTTFCGTAEYLAPEVIMGQPYSYEVDWWSFGTMLYEMLMGITPFWAENHADMYARVLHDPLVFPEDRVLDKDTKSILRGLLQRDPLLRIQEPRLKKHAYFSAVDWSCIAALRYIPPWQPPVDDELDTQNFEDCFLRLHPSVTNVGEVDAEEEERLAQAEREKAIMLKKDRMTAYALAHGCSHPIDTDSKSIFDGYSYRGRRDSSVFGPESDEGSEEETSEEESGNDGEHASPGLQVQAAPDLQEQAPQDAAVPVTSNTSASPPSETVRATAGSVPRLPTLVTSAPGASTISTTEVTATATPSRTPLESSIDAMPIDGHDQSSMSASNEVVQTVAHNAVVAPDQLEENSHAATYGDSAGHAREAAPEKPKAKAPKKRVKILSVHKPQEEHAPDEDEWAMVDSTELGSEVNGGRGQNLISRGVDIYRLRFRGEPTRFSTTPTSGPSSPTRKSSSWLGRRPMSPSRERESASRALSRILGSDHQAVTDDEGMLTLATDREHNSRSSRITRSPSPSRARKTRKASSTLPHVEEGERKASNKKRMKRFTRYATTT